MSLVLQQMDRFGIEKAMIGVSEPSAELALKMFPDRFIPSGAISDPNDVMGSVNAIRREYEQFGIRATSVFPSGTFPQVPIDDPKMYPIYATCVELGIPIFVCAGVPGPRIPMAPQEVSRIDIVMFDFPDLVFVTRHGCEPWEDLAVKLMLKWPNLYYSTSAFAPKYYPKAIIDYANSARCRQGPLRRLLPDGAVAGAHLQRSCPRSRSRTRCGRSSCTATLLASSAWRAEQPMALAITAEQEQLVDAVSRFATRHAPIEKTRAMFDSIAAGELPPWWEEFTAHGFHAVHLPEQVRWPGRQSGRYGLRGRGRRSGDAARAAARHGDGKRRGESG